MTSSIAEAEDSDGPLARLDWAIQHAAADPHTARCTAEPLADHPNPEIRTAALRALGVAARAADDIVGAERHLNRAVAVADEAALTRRAAEARLSLVTVLSFAGRNDEALRLADLAEPALVGRDRVRLLMRRALVLQRLGQRERAIRELRPALLAARALGDLEGEAQLLGNRGTMHAYQGRFATAERDLERARRLFFAAGQPVQAADALHNLGFASARRGDFVTALARFDAAEEEWAAHRVARPVASLDRCEALLSVRLADDAWRLAARAVVDLDAAGMHADRAEALLLLADAALLRSDAAEALTAAREAEDAFRSQGREPWALLASYAVLRARRVRGERGSHLVWSGRALADRLAAAGWTAAAVDARVTAARLALEAGSATEALADLGAAGEACVGGSAAVRAQAWLARALAYEAHGDHGRCWRALHRGLGAVADGVATVGATELRVHSAGSVDELAAVGFRLALRSGSARRVQAWSDATKNLVFRAPRARPPRDPAVAELLARLRRVVADSERSQFAGMPDARLLVEQAQLEQEVRRRVWRSDPIAGRYSRVPPDDLVEQLGDRALLQFVESGGEQSVVVVAGRRWSLHKLGRVAPVATEVDNLRFALSRWARNAAGSAPAEAVCAAMQHAAARLDGALLAPVRARIADRSVVIVPTGPLHALPWMALPSLRQRPVTVAPSAALWAHAEDNPGTGRVVLAAGPAAAGAAAEIADLARLHGAAVALTGEAASVDAVSRALDGAALAHIAAHGDARADNPLFASVLLADGPLTVYDLETLSEPPRRLVLSACEVGAGTARAGDAVMGLAATVLGMGTSTLVASVVPVGGEACRMLMARFHRELLRGASPAEALANAAAGEPTGFVCLGRG